MASSPAVPERSILHVDMDAFFASVEERDNPELRGLPVIVGGIGRRGVVSAASYAARRFGVHSAMPTARARRLCPDGVYLAPRMQRYQEISRQVFSIFHDFTPLVEGLSIDEAFLDVSGCHQLHGDIETIGRAIKKEVRARTGLTASVGMAYNKFLAKLASDLEKPDGLVRITPANLRATLDPLPVTRLWGLGKRSAERAHQAGIHTIGELLATPVGALEALFGRQAEHYRCLAEGRDQRAVVPSREEKSIGSEQTFAHDLRRPQEWERVLLAHADKVAGRLRAASLSARTVQVKIRTGDFSTYTRRHSLAVATCETAAIYQQACELLRAWHREHGDAGLRLLGVSVAGFEALEQGDLFAVPGGERELDAVVDRIREQFGAGAIRRGRLLGHRDRSD
ncbi:MAG: DNA polymerase IV [Gammaproteobacteria bacterium]|nr:DNA polymerase IV [Gammaproteobacteria bacterium]